VAAAETLLEEGFSGTIAVLAGWCNVGQVLIKKKSAEQLVTASSAVGFMLIAAVAATAAREAEHCVVF
jgi:hypothetical protein